MFMSGEMRTRYQKTTDAGRKETAVISLLWENKRLIDFVMLSSSVSEYSSGITSQQNRSHPVHADMQCDGISPPVTADTVMCSTENMKLTKSILRYFMILLQNVCANFYVYMHYWHTAV